MKKSNQTIAMTVVISGVILVIALAALLLFRPSVNIQNSLNVQGVATVNAMPDLVTINFRIETTGDTNSEAKNANTEIYNELYSQLVVLGFEEKEIQTVSFNVYPEYDWNDGARTEVGYRASHSIRVELPIDRSDELDEIIDVGVDAGAGISYINYELTQELQNEYKAEAMKLAAKDAKAKAEAVSQGFDKKVGKLISVSINDFGYYPWNVYSDSGMEGGVEMAKEVSVDMAPSEQEITARVSAVFKLR